MKTPLQELIEFIESGSADSGPDKDTQTVIIEFANELLEKEKQTVVDAFNMGHEARFPDGDCYYNEKFK